MLASIPVAVEAQTAMATVAVVYFEWLNASPGGDVLQLLQLMPQLMQILTRLDGK